MPPDSAAQLIDWVQDAGGRSLILTDDLTDDQMKGPHLEIVNPLLWELGHVAWFYEKWVLRHTAGLEPVFPEVDRLYDSASIPHPTRWDLPLPDRRETLAYVNEVRRRVTNQIETREMSEQLAYFVKLSVFHEDMHSEAYTYTRQTLGYPAPVFPDEQPSVVVEATSAVSGDVRIPGGTVLLGADESEPFIFDNEKWAHPVEISSFAISRTAVTQAEFAGFVEEGGYRRQEFWSDDGWNWRESAQAEQPVYWQREGNGKWLRRVFDEWAPLEPDRPVLHVNWYEAEAFCRWAGRRLPSEAEWETAAAVSDSGEDRLPSEKEARLFRKSRASAPKRRFPWGEEPPDAGRANMDWRAMGTIGVGGLPAGDSPCGCRQMIGNVWEWTADDFLPYPGFIIDPYKEYSQPWFGDHKVLRGGGWATRSRLIRNTWRNFYTPDRRDVWAGFRTCAVED